MSLLTLELSAIRNDKPTDIELKGKKIEKCPFCHGEEISVRSEDHWFFCQCNGCGAQGPSGSLRIHAITRWQRRHNMSNLI